MSRYLSVCKISLSTTVKSVKVGTSHRVSTFTFFLRYVRCLSVDPPPFPLDRIRVETVIDRYPRSDRVGQKSTFIPYLLYQKVFSTTPPALIHKKSPPFFVQLYCLVSQLYLNITVNLTLLPDSLTVIHFYENSLNSYLSFSDDQELVFTVLIL